MAVALDGNVADLLRQVARRYPDRPALITHAGSRSWAELERATDAGARALRAAGLEPGDRVAIALPTGPDLALSLFACARAGLVAVPVGPGHADFEQVADRVSARAEVSRHSGGDRPVRIGPDELRTWWSSAPGEPLAAVGGGEDLALLARARSDRPVMLSHRAVLAAQAAIGRLGDRRMQDGDRALQVLPMYHIAGWAVAFLPNTLVGGASVIPEVGFDTRSLEAGVVRTDGPPRTAADVGQGSPDDRMDDQSRAAVAAGIRAAASALDAARDHRVTVISGAPGFFHHLLAVPGAQASLSSVRVLTSGTAPLKAGDRAAFQELAGKTVWEGYGLSESSAVVTSTLTAAAPRPGSLGRPVAGVELRILGPDGGDGSGFGAEGVDGGGQRAEGADGGGADGGAESLETSGSPGDPLDIIADTPDAGEVGRVAVRGPTLFSGYWPGGTDGPGADGWFVTNDIGFLDDEGELHLVDRAGEVIRVAGFTVYPREIEEVLNAHPAVAEAAVVGIPWRRGVDRIVAVVVAVAGATVTAAQLAEFVAGELPDFKHPDSYRTATALPRTDVGRLDRAAVLRDQLAQPFEEPPAGETDSADQPDDAVTDEPDEGADAAEPDIDPEPAADLDELGARLPADGSRADRGRQDTDADLFDEELL